MSASTDAESERPGDSKAEASEGAIHESQLQRTNPDSILADEADPDKVLGQEHSSDAIAEDAANSADAGQDEDTAALKRASAASAIFIHSDSRPQSQVLSSSDTPANPARTTTGSSASASASSEMSVEELQAQVKDLGNQVAGLNEKLVRSFNRIADLEDDYSEAQERLVSMSTKIKELEKERAEHLAALDTGLLVEKAHVSSEMQRMMDRVIEETAQRGQAESDKSKIESELDELSSSLFSEANKMVAVERLSRARAEEKSQSMEERLKDTEGIMLEQQKVLTDLQRQVEKLQGGVAAKSIVDDNASIVSTESEAASFHRLKTSSLARSISQRTATRERKHKPTVDFAAEARLIINIVPYQEFRAFIAHLRKIRKQLAPFWSYPMTPHGARESLNSTPTPRTASPAIQQSANGTATTTAAASSYSQGLGSTVASSSPFAIAGVGRHRDYPTLPSNVENLVSLPNQLSLPFIKRSQEEDIEPCLRLDFAPGLNWLSRRSVNTAILDGNLLIEPLFSGSQSIDEDLIRRENAHLPPAGCAMCGTAVVNVPLPGGTAATASAEQAGKTSVVPSSIAGALGSFTGSSSANNSATVTPRPSRGGLFSSFRKSSSNVKATEVEATASPDTDAAASMASEAIVVAHLPVPTHIFRLSDSSATRYLLCPQHCLLRLRAACQYWGFIRHLERTVVIEGKFANEEQPVDGGLSIDLPKEIAAVQLGKSTEVETLEKAVAAEESGELGGSTDAEVANVGQDADAEMAEKNEVAQTTEKSVDEETDNEKTEAEQDKESVEDEAATAAVNANGVESKEESASTDDEKDPSGEQEDFADAESSPLVQAQPDDGEAQADDAVEAGKLAEATVTTTEPKTPVADTTTAAATAPPLPPRSIARNTNSPAPTIPPRRHLTPQPPPLPARSAPTYSVAPAPPTAIYLSKLETLEWEDRMWTEVTKLKEDVWRARVGLLEAEEDA